MGLEKVPKAPINGREHYTAIWTGEVMIVWGGYAGGGLGDGAVLEFPKFKKK
jgi:hypothetical protein